MASACERLAQALGRQRELVRHTRALPHASVAAAIGTMHASKATETVNWRSNSWC